MKDTLKYTVLPVIIGIVIGSFLAIGGTLAIIGLIDSKIESSTLTCGCVCCEEVENE